MGALDEPLPTCDPREGCITCGDEAEPMRVLEVDAAMGLARCAGAEGLASDVEIALVEPVEAGEDVLVHAGVAIARLTVDEEVAAR